MILFIVCFTFLFIKKINQQFALSKTCLIFSFSDAVRNADPPAPLRPNKGESKMVLSTLIQKAWPGRLQRFLKDTSGNMAIVVASSALPLMMAGGAAVDYGNWVSVEARL